MKFRFSYEAPGLLRQAWLSVFSDWRQRVLPWITDHERGERFQLSEDEFQMMNVLCDTLLDVMPVLSRNRFWKEQGVDIAKDQVLAAISDHHHGNAKEWDRFKAMTPEEWIDWVRATENEASQSRGC
jgi:hypothetical protein